MSSAAFPRLEQRTRLEYAPLFCQSLGSTSDFDLFCSSCTSHLGRHGRRIEPGEVAAFRGQMARPGNSTYARTWPRDKRTCPSATRSNQKARRGPTSCGTTMANGPSPRPTSATLLSDRQPAAIPIVNSTCNGGPCRLEPQPGRWNTARLHPTRLRADRQCSPQRTGSRCHATSRCLFSFPRRGQRGSLAFDAG